MVSHIKPPSLLDVKKRMIDRLLNNNDIQFDVDPSTGEILIPTGFYENATTHAIQSSMDPNWDEDKTGEDGDED